MASQLAAVLPLLFSAVAAQQIGTMIPETHPKLPTMACTRSGGCVERQTSLVADSLARPMHLVSDPSVACSITDTTHCPDAETCSRNCALEGVDYQGMGVTTAGNALTLRMFLPQSNGSLKAVSPRVYLLAEDEKNYEMLKLNNQEFTYEVDMSKAGCGTNGALYLSEMEQDGGRSDANAAGAQYGTGYCDAQCFNTTFINGLVSDRTPPPNGGTRNPPLILGPHSPTSKTPAPAVTRWTSGRPTAAQPS
jgi:cellulase